MSIDKLESMLDAQTKNEFLDKAKAADRAYADQYHGMHSVLSLSISKHDVQMFLDGSISKSVTVTDILKFIRDRYWEKHKVSILSKAKLNLLRDVKTLAGITKDYYG